VNCPSKNLTLTPRQRIVAYRNLTEKALSGKDRKKTFRRLEKEISYPMDETCATDGLCAIACPVGINTGTLVKELRFHNNGRLANNVADAIAANMDKTTASLRGLMKFPHAVAKLSATMHSKVLLVAYLK